MHQKTTLPNGLRVITYPMEGISTVTLLVVVQAGSKYETKEINGVSHFLEHMFFKGTTKRPNAQAISETLDVLGGEFNAFTSKEWTGYYVKADSRHLDLLFDVISDMFLHSKLSADEIKREKGVIIEEMNMYQDTPTRYIEDLIELLLYGKNQPAGWFVLGSKETILNMTRQQMAQYVHAQYVARDTVVIIVGDIYGKDKENYHTRLEQKVASYFKEIPVREPSGKSVVTEKQDEPQVLFHYKKTDQSHLELAVRAYRASHRDMPALSVLSTILGGNMSSRLFFRIRERHGLCYYIRSGITAHTDSGYLSVRAGVDNVRFEMALKKIMAELREIRAKGVLQKELEKAKDYLRSKLNLSLETSSDVAFWLGEQEMVEGAIKTKQQILKEINAVTLADISRIALDIFRNDKLNLAVIGPYKNTSPFIPLLRF
ncbi:MAG: Peptidase M16 domain protein [Parcubacteria group bacterium GW2011_GWA2_44_12]|nr:MAG: Peptidase M16 domain protein [Parcubacteria group bacterium GW2011_GWA2_44_12]